MNCKNCGTEYEDTLAECPYCGTENYKKSVEEHHKVLDEYQEKTKKVQELPRLVEKKGAKLLWIGLLVLIVIAIVGPFVASKKQALESQREYEKRLETLDTLEDLYQAGEYAALYKMRQDGAYNSFDKAFQKYTRVGELANSYERSLEQMESGIELAMTAKKLGISGGEEDLSQIGYYIRLLETCEEYEAEDYPYEEEDGINYYREKIVNLLTERYLLTEEEVYQGIKDYKATGEKPTYLYEISYERLTMQGEEDSEM